MEEEDLYYNRNWTVRDKWKVPWRILPLPKPGRPFGFVFFLVSLFFALKGNVVSVPNQQS